MRFSITLATFCALAAGAHAGSVTVSAQQSVGVSFQADPAAANANPGIASSPALKLAVQTGDDLLAGQVVLVGSYKKTDADLQAHATDVGYLISNFIKYDSVNLARVGDAYPGQSGIFSKQLTGSADALSLVGQQIYVFVLGSTDTSTLSRSLSTAFQVGIYYMDRTADTDWAFRADATVPNGTSIDLADLTLGGGQFISPSAHVVLGSFGPDTPNSIPGSSGKNFSLVAVPEPGTGVMALSGGLALLLRRRRQA